MLIKLQSYSRGYVWLNMDRADAMVPVALKEETYTRIYFGSEWYGVLESPEEILRHWVAGENFMENVA